MPALKLPLRKDDDGVKKAIFYPQQKIDPGASWGRSYKTFYRRNCYKLECLPQPFISTLV
jgi:hypothetical protein